MIFRYRVSHPEWRLAYEVLYLLLTFQSGVTD
jgi:hypothetical protein